LKDAAIELPLTGRLLAGIGEDCAVIQVREDLALISTTDVFTPLVDEGYIQGQITACNVTNDIYAMGVIDIVGVLILQAFPYEMPHTIAVNMLKGFSDFVKALDAPIVGGHTLINPWPLLGGTAMGISHPAKITYSTNAKPGDVLLLTKALGTQVAMAVYRLLREPAVVLEEVFPDLSIKELRRLPELAIKSMTTSSKPVAEIIQTCQINASTDITGFGLVGHATEMAERSKVSIVIDTLPVFNNTLPASRVLGYPLELGTSAETAGGLLLSVPLDTLDLIITELKHKGISAFQVGKVLAGTGKVQLSESVEILNVDAV